MGKFSNKIFDMPLGILMAAFPEAMARLPKNYYEVENVLKDLWIGCEKYDTCSNDFILYWGKDVNAKIQCETCKELRRVPSEHDPNCEKSTWQGFMAFSTET